MTIIDIVLAGLVGIMALMGLFTGVVRLALLLLSWVGAMIVAHWSQPSISPLLLEYMPILEGFAAPVSSIITFVLVLVLLLIVASLLRRLLEGQHVGILSRILGCLLGSLLAVAVVAICYAALTHLVEKDDMPSWIMEARARPTIEAIVNVFTPFLSSPQPPSQSITSPLPSDDRSQ